MKPDDKTSRNHRVDIEKPVYGGDSLAHIDGKAVFVPFTIPGETAFIHAIEDKRRFIDAELIAILTPSPNRIPPPCPHFGICGGCHYQHADYATQLALKQQILSDTILRTGLASLPEIETLSGDPPDLLSSLSYRNRIRLAITAEGEVGYRIRNSHEIIPIRECPIAAPILVEVALAYKALFDADVRSQDLAELELFTNQDSSELLITFHHNSADPIHRTLRITPREGSRPSAAPFDQPFLTYRVADHAYRVPHGAFFQINRHLLDDFAALVTANQAGNLAWDLYAGVGLFARQLTASFAQVIAVESAPASTAALAYNLAGTSSEAIASTTLDYLRRNREHREPRPDLIVLDPPRAGLGPEVTTLLNAIGAPALVYVSCDPTTLARDLQALTSERYRIDKITLVDLFPQTFHIETVVQLTRS
jgi:23S rRNA (uracil1939-C5)-methyltransferase